MTSPLTTGERLKYALIPASVHMWRMVRRHIRRGEGELEYLPQLVARDTIAVDAGANKGVYSYVLSKLCRRVEAFEPNPKMFAILQRCARHNVTAHQVALSDTSGEADLSFPAINGKSSYQRATLRATDGASVRVKTRTLDSYDLHNVGFIKIDVEGFEEAVLDGARETLQRERPVLLIEMAESLTGRPLSESIANVEARGYAVFFLRDGALRPASERDGRVFNFIAKPVVRK